jgi:putative tricarboxylic transport membrane protein
MLEAAANGFEHFLTIQALLYLALGAAIGLTFGAIPGLGGPTALALLIPLTFGMDSFAAISLFGGVMGAVPFGGSITAILLNTPGTAPNAATCFDGYPMARMGQAGRAIGAAGAASAIGGLLGIIVLVAFMPVLRELVLFFGPPEFLMLALLGLSAVAVATPGQLLRGLMMGGVGLMLAFAGFDRVHGGLRFTFGVEYMWDGVRLIPALIGMFALAEIINLSVRGGSVATKQVDAKIHGVTAGIVDVFRHYKTLIRGSVIGAFVGAVPGVGGTVASFLSYSTTVQMSREPESFGKGNVEGVIAPEASNNAKDGGSLIPTLAFGIPGSTEMAVFLGALVLHGIQPGPLLILDNPDIIFTLIYALSFACVFASLFGFATARYLVRITEVDSQILAVVVPVVALVGAYALRNSFGDVATAVVFGIVGYLMIRLEFPRLTLVIALVLGNLAEVSFFQSARILRDDWLAMLSRPPVGVLAVLILVSLSVPAVQRILRRRKAGRDASAGAQAGASPDPVSVSRGEWAFSGFVLLFIIGFLIESYTYSEDERTVPLLAAWGAFAIYVLDVLVMSDTRLGRIVAIVFPRVRGPLDRSPAKRAAALFVWFAGLAIGIYLIGFLVTIPLYVVASLVVRGRRRPRMAAMFAAGVFATVWVVFEWLMGYELYRGILFGAV